MQRRALHPLFARLAAGLGLAVLPATVRDAGAQGVEALQPPRGPLLSIPYKLLRHERIRRSRDMRIDDTAYLSAGSCVVVETRSPAPLSETFAKVVANGDRALMRIGLVPTDALAPGEPRPPGEVCMADIVETPGGAPMPPSPAAVAPWNPPLPPHRDIFAYSEFYVVIDDANMRDRAEMDRSPFITVKKGSCVQQFRMVKEDDEQAKVTAYATIHGGKILSGWMPKAFLRPAIGQYEAACSARMEDYPYKPTLELRLP